jgi:pyruvate,orthophosphate dikinase
MIEIPRAALTADEIAAAAEFFSFGTNDLTRPPSASPRTMWTDFCPILLKQF